MAVDSRSCRCLTQAAYWADKARKARTRTCRCLTKAAYHAGKARKARQGEAVELMGLGSIDGDLNDGELSTRQARCWFCGCRGT